jgi:phospholipase/carboxylesterase
MMYKSSFDGRRIALLFLVLLLSGGIDAGALPDSFDLRDPKVLDLLDIDLDSMRLWAFEAYRSEDYEEAARRFLVILDHSVEDVNSLYNLACCYSLVGELGLATRTLERAVRAGFTDLEYIRRDADFTAVRGTDEFRGVVDSLRFVQAKENRESGSLLMVEAPSLHRYRLRFPDPYDPDRAYPLVVGLHGHGGGPERFARLYEEFESPQFIFVCPEGPYSLSIGGSLCYTWTLRFPGDDAMSDSTDRMAEDYILRTIDHLKRGILFDEVYLMGFSLGGTFAYTTAIKNSERFTGIIALGTQLKRSWVTDEELEAANHLRVFIVHGERDGTISYQDGLYAKNLLERHGYDVTFREFPGGHELPEEVLKDVGRWVQRGP